MKSPWNLDKVLENLVKAKREIVAEVANTTQSYFEGSWRKQGWDGKRWKEVKRRIPGTNAYKYPKKKGLGRRTRAINVGKGRTRRSFVCISKRFERMVIQNTSPYSSFINEGTENMPARPIMGQTAELTQIQTRIITKGIDRIWK